MTNALANSVTLTSKTESGDLFQATFLPEKGMNLVSLKKNDLEIIDQSTFTLFEERFAGLGALIGPHFHRRRSEILPVIADESLFPHIARVKAKGVADPFSHGIGRYAPWKATFTETSIKAVLSGKDTWHEVPLSLLEGQNFKMNFQAEWIGHKLVLNLDVVSDTDSLVGIHYYYHLPSSRAKIKAAVQSSFIDQGKRKPIPDSWNLDAQHQLIIDLEQAETDYTFFPYPNPREGEILLETETYSLLTTYSCPSQENSWQLYHPKGASFVCIEPLSAQDPRHPNLTVSSIRIELEIS